MNLRKASERAFKSLLRVFPGLFGIMILISLFNTFVPANFFKIYFHGSFLGPLLGALAGSVATGSPAINYLFSGDLIHQGFPLLTVTAFMLAWGTVGIVQLPAEMRYLGKKFALARNLSAFVFSLIAAFLTIFLLSL